MKVQSKYASARIIYDRRKTATSSNDKKPVKGSFFLEIRYKGERRYYSTPVRVYRNQYDEKRNSVRYRADSIELNNILDDILRKANDYIAECQRKDREFTFRGYEKAVSVEASMSFLDYMEQRIEERNDIMESTKRTHRATLRILRNWGVIETFDDLTKKNIVLLNEHFRSLGMCKATIHDKHKHVKVYINDAIAHEVTAINPYSSMKIDRGETKAVKYVTEEELQTIEELTFLSKPVENARDVFVFACYTGLAYADLVKFDEDRLADKERNIKQNSRKKTGGLYSIVLLPKAKEILEKHGGRLPLVNNAKYNLYLKCVQQMADIDTRLTTHVARHTFACLMLNHGVPIEVVAKMMGHADIRTTQVYAKVLAKTVEQEFERVAEIMENKKGKR